MRLYLLPLTAALGLSACAPRALYFHESTKVAFAADYNTSDTQPLATSFGFKRRIVAVVPSQEREIPEGGSERTGTNTGEALSLVSKFSVRVGAREGLAITNNFASGMAARIMTRTVSPAALNAMLNSPPIEVSAETGRTIEGNKPAAEAVNERLARIKSREVRGDEMPEPKEDAPMPPGFKKKKPAAKDPGSPPEPSSDAPMPKKHGTSVAPGDPASVPDPSGVAPMPRKPGTSVAPSGAAPEPAGNAPMPKKP